MKAKEYKKIENSLKEKHFQQELDLALLSDDEISDVLEEEKDGE